MPLVEPWMKEELKRYDKSLDLVWGCSPIAIKVMGEPLPRYVVICKTKFGDEVLLIIQNKDGAFVQPHPNFILYGNKDLGIQGLVERDLHKNGGFDKWVEGLERREEEYRIHKRKIMKAKNEAFANEIWNSSLMNPRVYVKSPLNKEEE